MRHLALLLTVAAALTAQPKGKVEQLTLHSKALEGNLLKDSPDRSVRVYLPPSYETAKKKRFPVLYMLHGFTDSDEKWFADPKHWINLPTVLDQAIAGGAREMIVVMPNALNSYGGSMYSSSVTIGDWETFVARELPAFIDAKYRTIPQRESRGLAGHSMGGYGALRVGIKNPDVFSSLYLLNPCCLQPGASRSMRNEGIASPADVAKADFTTKAGYASAGAWSPNPNKPPFFIDLPSTDNPLVTAKWTANAPLAMIDQYIPALRRMKAIGLDAGNEEQRSIAPTTKALSEALTANGIANQYEEYPGNHTNGVATRIVKVVMPFFSRALRFE